jgi:hypothetical protein
MALLTAEPSAPDELSILRLRGREFFQQRDGAFGRHQRFFAGHLLDLG